MHVCLVLQIALSSRCLTKKHCDISNSTSSRNNIRLNGQNAFIHTFPPSVRGSSRCQNAKITQDVNIVAVSGYIHVDVNAICFQSDSRTIVLCRELEGQFHLLAKLLAYNYSLLLPSHYYVHLGDYKKDLKVQRAKKHVYFVSESDNSELY